MVEVTLIKRSRCFAEEEENILIPWETFEKAMKEISEWNIEKGPYEYILMGCEEILLK